MAPKPKRNATTFSRLPDFEEVALDIIQPNRSQPRTNLSEPQAQAKLASLAQSIDQYGLQQPILIRRMDKPAETGEVYEIVAGKRVQHNAALGQCRPNNLPQERLRFERRMGCQLSLGCGRWV